MFAYNGKAYELSGVITDENSIGRPNQQIILMSCEATEIGGLDDSLLKLPTNSFLLSTTSGSDGCYKFTNLLNGCYIISIASSPLFNLQYEYYTTNVAINDSDISNVILRPVQYMRFSLYGNICTASGGVIGAVAQVFPSSASESISIDRLQTIRTFNFADGKIFIPDMPNGHYDLWFSEFSGVKDYGSIIPIKLSITALGEVIIDEVSTARLTSMGIHMKLSTSPDGNM